MTHWTQRMAALRSGPLRGRTNEQRFMDLVSPEPNTGCWLWLAFIDRDGYGRSRFRGRAEEAHRAAYTIFVGPIPEGLDIDHRCFVRACVNPAHLIPTTHTANLARRRYQRRAA